MINIKKYKVMSFDLDNTLYDNVPVLEKAEQALFLFLQEKLTPQRIPPLSWWIDLSIHLLNQHNSLEHDITALRKLTLYEGIGQIAKTLTQDEIKTLVNDGMSVFMDWRNKIVIGSEVNHVLMMLKKKYRLVIITNGNAQPQLFMPNYSALFDMTFFAGQHGKKKPHVDLFSQCCEYCNIQPNELIHVGDMLEDDVYGAKKYGADAIWLRHSAPLIKNQKYIADLEITDLVQLLTIFVEQ